MRYRPQGPFATSVNAKQLKRLALRADPSRCKSDHGYHFVRVAQIDSEHHSAKVEVAGAIPAVDAICPCASTATGVPDMSG